MAILDLFGLGGRTPVDTNYTPVMYDESSGNPPGAAAPTNTGVLSQPQQSGGILSSLGIKTDNFGNRLANGIIAAGSNDPLKAIVALQESDREAEKQRIEAGKPKVTPLADGAFSLITFPNGTTKIVKNEDVAAYITDQNQAKFLQGLVKAQVTADANATAGNNKVNYKADLEQAGGPGAPTTYRETVTNQIGKIDALIAGIPEIDKIKTQFGNIESPAIASIIDSTIGRVAGTDAYSLRRDFDSLIGTDVLQLAEKMKGALSDKDVMFLKSIQPKPDDPTDRKITYLTELKKRLDAGEQARMAAAQRIANTPTTNAQGTPGAPKSSGGVVQVTSEDQWKQLAPGTMYKDPNGVIRTKK